jgi:hypothetical protein
VTYGGDSGNRIFFLYWRCSLIRVSVIRGSTLFTNFFDNTFYPGFIYKPLSCPDFTQRVSVFTSPSSGPLTH